MIKIIARDVENAIPIGAIIFECDLRYELHQLFLGKLVGLNFHKRVPALYLNRVLNVRRFSQERKFIDECVCCFFQNHSPSAEHGEGRNTN